jgi:hypothetical protein
LTAGGARGYAGPARDRFRPRPKMVLCPYGSAPKAGAPPYVWLSWLDAQPWLGATIGKLSWLAYLVPAVVKEINSFCTTDPPQPIAPSDADIVAAVTDPLKFEALIQYIKDSIYWWVWSNQCVCNPNPSLPPTCTSGWTNTFVPLPVVGPGGAAFEVGTRFTNLQAGAQFSGFRVWIPQAYVYAVGLTLWDSAGAIVTSTTVSAGILVGYHTFNVTPVTLVAGAQYVVSMCVNIGYQWYESPTAPTNDAVATYVSHVVGSGCGSFPVNPTGGWEGILPILCVGAAPTRPAAPPVPVLTIPDFPTETSCTTQDVCNLAQQLLSSVTMIRSMVDLIQRQGVPFGYVVGTVHSGLSGSGTIAVSDILGLLVQVSTIPIHWGLSSDNPQRYIPAPAMVAVGTLAGDQDTHFVHFTEEMVFPPAMGAMTTVRYEFKPGCGGAITELIREP